MIRDCVCKRNLHYWEEIKWSSSTTPWKEVDFRCNELYSYTKKVVKRSNLTVYKLQKRDEEGIILKEFFTLSDETFEKHFIDISVYREQRIDEILK